MNDATRSVEKAPWRAVDRPRRCGFGAAVRRLSGAAIVDLMALASSAIGATGSVSRNGPISTPSIFAPVSTPAFAIRDLSYFVLGICAVIFIVVAGLLAYSLIRFRRRPADADRELPQVYGSNQIELAWTVVPVLIVVILFLATARYIFAIEGHKPPHDIAQPGAEDVLADQRRYVVGPRPVVVLIGKRCTPS